MAETNLSMPIWALVLILLGFLGVLGFAIYLLIVYNSANSKINSQATTIANLEVIVRQLQAQIEDFDVNQFILAGGNTTTAPLTIGTINAQPVNIIVSNQTAIALPVSGPIRFGVLNWPTADGAPGSLLATDGNGNLQFVPFNGIDVILNGGNNFGSQPMRIGTLNAQGIQFITNGQTRASIDSSGRTTIGPLQFPPPPDVGSPEQGLISDGSGHLRFATMVLDGGNVGPTGTSPAGGEDMKVGTSDNRGVRVATNGIERMIISPAGDMTFTGPNVQVQGDLEVNGDVDVKQDLRVGATAVLSGLSYPMEDGNAGDIVTTDGFNHLSLQPPPCFATTSASSGGSSGAFTTIWEHPPAQNITPSSFPFGSGERFSYTSWLSRDGSIAIATIPATPPSTFKGVLYIFQRQSSQNWNQVATFVPIQLFGPQDEFGNGFLISTSADGRSMMAVGAPGDSGGRGAVYLFAFQPTPANSFVAFGVIRPPTGLTPPRSVSRFGESVAVSDNGLRLLITSNEQGGAIWYYERDPFDAKDAGFQFREFLANPDGLNGEFGGRGALAWNENGTVFAVGNPTFQTQQGIVYVVALKPTPFTPTSPPATLFEVIATLQGQLSGTAQFGAAVDLRGGLLAASQPGTTPGQILIFSGSDWRQTNTLSVPGSTSPDYLGGSLQFSGGATRLVATLNDPFNFPSPPPSSTPTQWIEFINAGGTFTYSASYLSSTPSQPYQRIMTDSAYSTVLVASPYAPVTLAPGPPGPYSGQIEVWSLGSNIRILGTLTGPDFGDGPFTATVSTMGGFTVLQQLAGFFVLLNGIVTVFLSLSVSASSTSSGTFTVSCPARSSAFGSSNTAFGMITNVANSRFQLIRARVGTTTVETSIPLVTSPPTQTLLFQYSYPRG